MTPIDLTGYANSSKKIPAKYLEDKSGVPTRINSWNILAAYALDLINVSVVLAMISGFIQLSFRTFMTTNSLQMAFKNIEFSGLGNIIFPVVVGSYFFFSYFFNHGQTWGMNVMKTRIEMKERNFKSSFIWTVYSAALVMTGGLSFVLTHKWIQKKNWGTFETHDHLYSNLIQEKIQSPVNLITYIENNTKTQTKHSEEEAYLEAA